MHFWILTILKISPFWFSFLAYLTVLTCRTLTPCAFRTSLALFSFPCPVLVSSELVHVLHFCLQTMAYRTDCPPHCQNFLPTILQHCQRASGQGEVIGLSAELDPMQLFNWCLSPPFWFVFSFQPLLSSFCYLFRFIFPCDTWILIFPWNRFLLIPKRLSFIESSSFITSLIGQLF